MFFKKRDESVIKKVTGLKHIEGIPGLSKDAIAEIFLYEDKIMINKDKFISIDRIIAVDFFSEKEVNEKGKSVIGRAAVGGLLLGPLGAIIGGVSGTGKKEKSKTHYFISIEFNGVDGTQHVAIFLLTDFAWGYNGFLKEIDALIGSSSNNIQGPQEV